MSMNDVPQSRETFAGFRIEAVPMTYKFKGTKYVTELLITGPRHTYLRPG